MKAAILALIAAPAFALAQDTLIPRAAEWRYLDSATPPGEKWTAPDFADAGWKSGPAPLGYGERGLGSTLAFGTDPKNKPLTAWFRRSFDVKDPAKLGALGIFLQCDDGAVVYLNGREVARENLPAGEISHTTEAESAIDSEDEGTVHRHLVPAKETLRAGVNVIAVEVHQAYASSSDLFLDLELKAWPPGIEPPAEKGNADRRLAAIERAYAENPGDMETAYAWVRAHVDARSGLAEKLTPRPIPKDIPAQWRFIADGPKWADSSRKITRTAALADLDYLEEMIANCYAYADRRGADWRSALDALRASITGDIGTSAFQWRIERFLTVFGDPHSRFNGNPGEPAARIPVVFAHHGERIVALKPDRSDYLRPGAPYVVAIEGIPVSKWIAAANDSVTDASPQFQRHLVEGELQRIELAWQLGITPGAELSLSLASADGKTTGVEKVRIGARVRGETEPPVSAKKAGDIGVLRISQMASGRSFIGALDKAMAGFRDTAGLVIDVRGNGGGTQDAIKTLLPYFMKPGDPMKIVNVAAYRLPLALPKPNPEGFLGLSGRGLHPATSKVWDDAQRAQILAFLKTWEPKWKLPAGKFSDWHVMAISRATNPAAFTYEKPVIVLQDEGCFSATDNFLGALKGHPGITLMGTTSGGGSGRMAGYRLPNAGLQFTLCQMASFATTGLTYDGNGVPPDITIELQPADFLRSGKDTLLEAALAKLRAK